jgi:hypothetical protein
MSFLDLNPKKEKKENALFSGRNAKAEGVAGVL